MDKEKVEQHQQLMEEFKRAHKKMFAHSLNDGVKTDDPRNLTGLASQSKEVSQIKNISLTPVFKIPVNNNSDLQGIHKVGNIIYIFSTT